MIYVASTYSHPLAEVRAERARTAEDFAAFYAERGKIVYCPIAAWHHIAERLGMPKNFEFWRRFDFSILRHCDEVWVLMIDGWEESVGVAAELRLAKELYLPIRYFSEDNFAESALQAYTPEEEEIVKGLGGN